MRIIVCIKQLADKSFNPFDLSALELGLSMEPEKLTVVTMGRRNAAEALEELTRLGGTEAVLLSDPAFAGSDTLATAGTLAAWLRGQRFDLLLCGRQSIDGETAQVGPELAQLLGCPLATRALEVIKEGEGICVRKREETVRLQLPAVVTVERSRTLRLPSLFSKKGSVTVADREQLGLAPAECGLSGSPTRVVQSYEKEAGRKCHMLAPEELPCALRQALEKKPDEKNVQTAAGERLAQIWITDEILRPEAERIAHKVCLEPVQTIEEYVARVREKKPAVILFPADWESRETAPRLAAALKTGLCADCTQLTVEDGELHMIRPALGGRQLAKIRCLTTPTLATVRCAGDGAAQRLCFAIGRGALPFREKIEALAEKWGAEVTASRGAVETGRMAYETQVGLTGKTVSPKVYVAFGISGAVHHIVGMETSDVVIAVNTDRQAPIFQHADLGVCCDVGEALDLLSRKERME